MKDLEEQQRAMRERNKRLTAKTGPAAKTSDAQKAALLAPASKPAERNELEYLRRRVSVNLWQARLRVDRHPDGFRFLENHSVKPKSRKQADDSLRDTLELATRWIKVL